MHVYDVEPDYVANNGSLGTYACMCCYMHLGLEPSNRFVFGTAACSSPKSSKDVTHTWLAMKLMHSHRERPQLHAFEWLDSHGMRRSYVIIRNHADGIMSRCIIRLRLTTAGAGPIDFRFVSLFHLIYRIPRLRTRGFVAKFHCVCNMSLKTYSSRVTVMFATKSSKRSSSNRTCRFYTRFFTIKYYPEPHSMAVYMVACTSQRTY